MIQLVLLLILFIMPSESNVIVSCRTEPHLKNWRIVDDVVMGGRSNGSIDLTPEGFVLFSGEISLENNGGFSSVRYDCPNTNVTVNSYLRVRLKGEDGKRYQFRVRHNRDRHSYITYFETNGDWQEIEFRLDEFVPTFRGRRLYLPNFNHNSVSEIGFLIGNKKAESFNLLIEKIELIDNE